MAENKTEQRALTFNEDGTIDPAQLEGMPQEFIDRVTSPEFQAEARRRIKEQRVVDQTRALYRQKKLEILAATRREHAERRPNGVSGRQRRRLKRLARNMQRATLLSEGKG